MDCGQMDPADLLGTATGSAALASSEPTAYVPANNLSSSNYTHQSPLRKLSIDLIKTYRHINAVRISERFLEIHPFNEFH